MNRKLARPPAQALLQFEQQEIWQQLPNSQRSLCRELLTQLLVEVVSVQGDDDDERKD